jgi:hypothetical protein
VQVEVSVKHKTWAADLAPRTFFGGKWLGKARDLGGSLAAYHGADAAQAPSATACGGHRLFVEPGRDPTQGHAFGLEGQDPLDGAGRKPLRAAKPDALRALRGEGLPRSGADEVTFERGSTGENTGYQAPGGRAHVEPCGVHRDDGPALLLGLVEESGDIGEITSQAIQPGDQERVRPSRPEAVQRCLQTGPGGGGNSAADPRILHELQRPSSAVRLGGQGRSLRLKTSPRIALLLRGAADGRVRPAV